MPTMSFWTFGEIGQNLVGKTPATVRFFSAMTESVKENGDVGYHGEYWTSRGRAELAERIVANGIPVMLNAGWRGVVEMGAVRAYTALQNAHAKRPVHAPMRANQSVSPRYQLIMGGWDHGNGLDTGLYLQWLDTWVKGADTGLQNPRTPMHLFEQGTNRWVNLSGYPQIDATRLRLGKGTLSSRQSTGRETLRYAQPSAALGRTSPEAANLLPMDRSITHPLAWQALRDRTPRAVIAN